MKTINTLYKTILKKAFFYSIVVTIALTLLSVCSWLLSVASTFANILGFVLLIMSIAGLIIFGIREGKYYWDKFLHKLF